MTYYGLWNLDYNQHLKDLPNNNQNGPNGAPNTPGGLWTPGATGTTPDGTSYTVDANGVPRINQTSWNGLQSIGGMTLDQLSPQGDGFTGFRNGALHLFGRAWAPGGGENDWGFGQWITRFGNQALEYARSVNPNADYSSLQNEINRYQGIIGNNRSLSRTGGSTGLYNGPFTPPAPSVGSMEFDPARRNPPPNDPNNPNSEQRRPPGSIGNNGPSLANVVQKGYTGQTPEASNTGPLGNTNTNPFLRNYALSGLSTGDARRALGLPDLTRNPPPNDGITTKPGQENPFPQRVPLSQTNNNNNQNNNNNNNNNTNPADRTGPGRGPPIVFPNDPDGRNRQGETYYNQILNNRNPYGEWGRVFTTSSLSEEEWQQLPEWLRRQFTPGQRGEDGRIYYEANSEIILPDGRRLPRGVAQIGDMSDAVGEGDGSVIDWNQVWYDPFLGMVTTQGNTRDIQSDWDRFTRFATIAGLTWMWGSVAGELILGNGTVLSPEATSTLGQTVNSNPGLWESFLNSLPEGVNVSSITEIATGAWEVIVDGVKWIWNNGRWIRDAYGVANFISQVTGNGPIIDFNNNNNNRRNPLGNNNNNNGNGRSFLDFLMGLGQTGINNYMDNENLRWFRDRQNELFNMGDFNSQYRPGYLSRLNEFMMNPEAALNDPTFQAVRNRNLGDLERRLNARGYNISGNEMGELTRYGQELDWQQIERERESLRRSANLGDPSGMARAGLQSLPFLFAMRGARNFDTLNGLGNLFGGNGGLGGGILNFLSRLFGDGEGGIDWENVDWNEVEEMFFGGNSGYGDLDFSDMSDEEWWWYFLEGPGAGE